MSNTSQMSTRTYKFSKDISIGDYPPSIFPNYKILGWSLIFIAALLFIGLSMTTPIQAEPQIGSGVSSTR